MSTIAIIEGDKIILPAYIRSRLCLNGNDELAIDWLGDGTLILKRANTREKFERWLSREGTSSNSL